MGTLQTSLSHSLDDRFAYVGSFAVVVLVGVMESISIDQ